MILATKRLSGLHILVNEMAINNNIKHIFEPTPLQCGQAVLAMLTGKTVKEIVEDCENEKETTYKQMVSVLNNNGIAISGERCQFTEKSELPNVALLSLQTPKCWHWSLYYNGMFYDPEYGLISEIPQSNRRYYWELENV